MTILASELLFYKSATVGAASTNGGRLSASWLRSGGPNNVWPHALKAERLAGSTLYRKIFAKIANDADESLLASKIWNDIVTPGDDYQSFFVGTQRDTQADITGSERIYGCAALNTDITSGGSVIVVDVEHSDLTVMFVNGDPIRITDMTSPTASTGNEEDLTISGVPVVSGTEVTITVSETIGNDYTVASSARVMSIYSPGTISATSDNWAETSTSGTYDETTYPATPDNIGTIEETWTLAFTSATEFSITGDTVGLLATTGDTSTAFAPINSDFSKPFFTLSASGWGGTWAIGDTIVFQTHPAAVAIWLKRVIPVACPSLSNNKNVTALRGESA